MTAPDFVHLHVHSEYSLLDGANRIEDLVAACVKDRQPAIALTDHGNMFGAIELYQKARASKIKPLLGCEVYVAKRSRLEPHNRTDNGYHHLTLIARTNEGYRNLLKLCSEAYVHGLHTRPRIDKEYLARHAAGISCLSGCLAGEINQLFLRGDEKQAEAVTEQFRDLFGRDHFWLELQRNGIDIQSRANDALMRLHARTGAPLVATNDIHYLRHEDCHAQDVLLCINTGAKRADEKRFKFDTDSLYFRTREEMGEIFSDLPQALKATLDVAGQVDVNVEFGKYHVPVFKPDTDESPDELFDRLCEEGLARWYGREHAAARERLEYEKKIIRQMGFVSYFLIVWDLIRWARDNGVPVGPGRGSAAGAIVAYVLGITKVDPLKYDLLFERFLNSARISMPDIDIDFCKEGREKVLAYTRGRYGAENVAQIVTFGTMASRTVVRDVGRVLDVPLKDIDRIAKKIQAGPNAPSLAEALEKDAELIAIRDEKPEFAEVFEFSKKLEGMARHISTHAAGVVIADREIVDYVPLARHDTDIVTQWPAPQLEELGLLKMDYLGLRTLTILERALGYIRRTGAQVPDLDSLPDDPKTYQMLTAGDTLAVFQLESEGMRKLLARIRPDRFEDLIAVLALYRPGPLESGMDAMFIRRKHGEEQVSYQHPCLEPILRDTYGCIVYQEQVMLISSALGGFSLNEADNLRKAMGKKKPEIMEKFAAQFVAGAVKNGCAEDAAREIWENIVKFGGYGFNKSHSTAYALITYQTAYLKANHRVEFLAANMACEMESSEKVKALIDDAKRAHVVVHPPDLRTSRWHFEPHAGAVRYGLGAIKGTGERAIGAFELTRDTLLQKPAQITLHELCRSCDPTEVPRTCWEALIKAGAFDFSGHNRGAVLAALDVAMTESQRAAADRRSGQGSLFGGGPSVSPVQPASVGDGIDDSKAWPKSETLKAERESLGFYLSGHPLEERAGLFAMLSTCRTTELAERSGGSEVQVAGLIVQLSTSVVKNGKLAGQKMARLRLEDLDGAVNVTVFPRTLEQFKHKLAPDAVVIVRGKVEERAEEPGIVLDEVLLVEEALSRFEGGVIVHLEPEDAGLLNPLRDTLLKFQGRRPLYFQVRGGDGALRRVRAGNNFRVNISAELAEQVDRILGKGRVRLARM
ncbi:MAG: DNA polymerase III subunit alpha [Planctomycetes bacterium]|nr:DNA polymerase III subunit alpha [Planctomycetota bacterium]